MNNLLIYFCSFKFNQICIFSNLEEEIFAKTDHEIVEEKLFIIKSFLNENRRNVFVERK